MAVNKVIYHGNTLIDLTSSTVTPGALALGVTAKNAKGETITGTVPVMGTISNKVITLTGDLANGTYTIQYGQTSSGTLVVANYTNQIPISTDTNGTIYNGKGYKEETRGSSSGAPSACTGGTNPPFFTGFIPCKKGDVIRLKNCYIHAHDGLNDFETIYGTGSFGMRFGLYNSSKTKIAVESWGNLNGNSNTTNVVSNYTRVADSSGSPNGKIYQFTIAYSNTAYIRLCLAADVANGCTPADAIVTVNQEIG